MKTKGRLIIIATALIVVLVSPTIRAADLTPAEAKAKKLPYQSTTERTQL